MKILVVDDQELNRNLLRFMLEQEQHHVALASDGEEALTVFDEFSPDLVLLDVVMPKMDGFEVAPLLKAKSADVYLPIIFITALDDKSSLEKCLQVGGDDFLNKPFDKVILAAKIKAHARTREFSIKTYKQNQELAYYQLHTEREHELVEHIFENALEKRFLLPELVEFNLSPASMFNGDLFLMAPSCTGGIYVLMGDFTGHGLAAAMGALPASKIFYSMTQKGLPVGDIAAELNSTLSELLPGNMFCAATILELNSSGRSFSAWLGGLPDSFLLSKGGKVKQKLTSRHMALGILEDYEFERDTIYVETELDDKIILYTDGVIEAENTKGEFFGEERLLRKVTASSFTELGSIVDSVKRFTGKQDQQDDLSLALVKCRPSNIEPQLSDEYMTTPLNMAMTLDAERLKQSDPVVDVVEMICAMKGCSEHRSNLFLLISETFNNALEHGVLGLESCLKDSDEGFCEYYELRAERLAELSAGVINIDVSYLPEDPKISFTITDSGDGFAGKNIAHDDNNFHGRGLGLIKEIAESVSQNERGNSITVTYSLLHN
ncbi:fused response regulator/phosphatase [Pseudoalteromonas sp. MMG024]|uniref:ATP-binding SpoIIE family protein phosphatase n=1 Tax=Pseudoalteromonas sp. MMG024 TaxID=2909980 RepID=UPI001F02CE6B|nr:fused response regulator/phosphatase [Pseudoalteromonas sp. MMG024]MCF6457137.1 SpoIIE family protein phosphatase [Pseudoalteromonas sp. MMG024]